MGDHQNNPDTALRSQPPGGHVDALAKTSITIMGPTTFDRSGRSRLHLLAPSDKSGEESMAMPSYKYAAQMARFPDCPPPNKSATGVAYRLVHSPMLEDDFLPNPEQQRNKNSDRQQQEESCTSWGLSMFTTSNALQKKFGRLIGKYPHIANDVGDHIAEGALLGTHGVITKPNKENHFNLFEYADVNIAVLFRVVSKIQPVEPK
jgi:hypothetical protein